MLNAKVHTVESSTAPQQRNGIFIFRCGIAYNIVERHAQSAALVLRSDKHTVEVMLGRHESAVMSPTAPQVLH